MSKKYAHILMGRLRQPGGISVMELVEASGISINTACRALKALADAGEAVRKIGKGGNSSRESRYWANPEHAENYEVLKTMDEQVERVRSLIENGINDTYRLAMHTQMKRRVVQKICTDLEHAGELFVTTACSTIGTGRMHVYFVSKDLRSEFNRTKALRVSKIASTQSGGVHTRVTVKTGMKSSNSNLTKMAQKMADYSAVNLSRSDFKKSNQCKTDAIYPEHVKPKVSATPKPRFWVDPDTVPRTFELQCRVSAHTKVDQREEVVA